MGIDHGLGLVNVDIETGIRYGIFPERILHHWVIEELQPLYAPCECEESPDCDCAEYADPDVWALDVGDDGRAVSWRDDEGDYWFTRGPYVYRADYASPCAPGAGYISRLLRADQGDCYAYGPEPELLEGGVRWVVSDVVISGKPFELVTRDL